MIFWSHAYYVVDLLFLRWQVGSYSREASWGFDKMETEHVEGKENQPRVAFPTM